MSRKQGKFHIIGEQFGRLTVISEIPEHRPAGGRKNKKKLFWLCRCVCGSEKYYRGSKLRGGEILGCGCFKKFNYVFNFSLGGARKFEATKTLGGSRAHKAWHQMLARCNATKGLSYKNYKSRGITVCDRWKSSFENFFEDMGECPANLSLDRVNNDGNYEIGNCRWADKRTQMLNTRRTLFIDGIKFNELCELMGVESKNVSVIRTRIFKLGWSVDKAFSKPINKYKPKAV